jgi:glycosyltransferase involved in cell wall biosynthesis
MKSILYFSTNLSSELYSGYSIVTYEQLKLLSNNNQVTLINFYNTIPYVTKLEIKVINIKINNDVWDKIQLPPKLPFQANDYQYVVFNSPEQEYYIDLFKDSKTIYLVNNTQYQKSKVTGLNINNQEELICKKSDINLFLTSADFVYFKTLGLVRKNDEVITPFINHVFFHDSKNRIENSLLITTNLETDYNKESLRWFLEDVLPLLPSDVNLTISGKGDFTRLKEHYKKVNFLGFIKRDDLVELYSKSKLFVNPTIHGSGIQIKMLEALSYGLPVVSTDYSNIFPNVIPSSNDPHKLANLITSSLNTKSKFNFEYFNNINSDKFLRLFDID